MPAPLIRPLLSLWPTMLPTMAPLLSVRSDLSIIYIWLWPDTILLHYSVVIKQIIAIANTVSVCRNWWWLCSTWSRCMRVPSWELHVSTSGTRPHTTPMTCPHSPLRPLPPPPTASPPHHPTQHHPSLATSHVTVASSSLPQARLVLMFLIFDFQIFCRIKFLHVYYG